MGSTESDPPNKEINRELKAEVISDDHSEAEGQSISSSDEESDSFRCTNCKKLFFCKSDLEVHSLIHTKLKPPNCCPICKIAVKNRRVFKTHLELHMTPITFLCVQCSKKFPTKKQLRYHERTHTRVAQVHSCLKLSIAKENKEFFDHFRVTKKMFSMLLQKLHGSGVIRTQKERSYKPYNKPVSTAAALLMTLWFLGKKSFQEMTNEFGISDSTIRRNVYTVIDYFATLSEKYLTWPTAERIEETEKEFRESYGFPGVVGVVGLCPIKIKDHDGLDRNLFQHKNNTTSVHLMAVCDATGNFIYVGIGNPGSESDESVLSLSPLGKKMDDNDDSPTIFHCRDFHLIGDKSFRLRNHLMVPYKGKKLLTNQENFNKKLSSIKLIIDKAFYLLKGRFERLQSLAVKFERVTPVVTACCVLHNLLLGSEEDIQLLFQRMKEFVEPPQSEQAIDDHSYQDAFDKRDQISSNLT